MELTGERVIAADRTTVWAALNDAEVLAACIPGCKEMEKTSDTSFAATVEQKVGPVKATFRGEVTLTYIVEPESYRIEGEGKGGAAGFAKGGARVRLEEVPEGTRLTYEAEAKVGGKLAQLGSRLIHGFARKLADDFFDRFKAQVEGPAEADAGAVEPDAAAAGEPAQPAAEAPAPEAPAPEAEAPPEPAAEAPAPEKKSWLRRLFGS